MPLTEGYNNPYLTYLTYLPNPDPPDLPTHQIYPSPTHPDNFPEQTYDLPNPTENLFLVFLLSKIVPKIAQKAPTQNWF